MFGDDKIMRRRTMWSFWKRLNVDGPAGRLFIRGNKKKCLHPAKDITGHLGNMLTTQHRHNVCHNTALPTRAHTAWSVVETYLWDISKWWREREVSKPHLPKTDSPLSAVSVLQDFLVLRPTTSAGAYVSSAHAGGSVGDVGLRMIWQSLSCSRGENPSFRRGLGHWRAEG